MIGEQLKTTEKDIIEYDTPNIKKQEYLRIEEIKDMRIFVESDSNKNLTDKYIQLEDKINGQIYELFNNNVFIALLEKYDVNDEKETLKILNNELINNEIQKENYKKLLEIKKNYNELTQLFNELNRNEVNKNILFERIKQNDKKLLDSSLLNNHLISSDNDAGIFKSNDYLKLLLLDLRILKKGVNLNNDMLLEREMITDMLNRNRVHFFSIRMNDLLKRHIEDVDILNKKDEDSFYLESVLRKKVNLIHLENIQLKEQINRDMLLISKKDQEISKLSFTLFSLQDQLDNSINNLRMKLKSKYGNFIHLHKDNTFDRIDSGESFHQNSTVNNQSHISPSTLRKLSEDSQVLFINKEIDNQQNNSNMHAHIRRHDYNINNSILKSGAKLLRINNDQTEVPKNSVISDIEKKFCELRSSIPSKLNILSQCKHVRSAISTPRDSVEQINSSNLINTPVNKEHELIENSEIRTHHESGFNEQADDKDLDITQKHSKNYKDEEDHRKPQEVIETVNNIIDDTEKIMCNDGINISDDCHKNESINNKNESETGKIKKTNIRQNLSLQNYKITDKKTNKIVAGQKNVQENERLNGKILPKSSNTDLKISRTNSKEHVKALNDELSSFSKPTAASLSKKRTKSKEGVLDDYNNSISNNMFRTNSKTNLVSVSHLKGGIFDDSYVHNESIISANILSKRNLRKANSDLDNIVPKTKTNLVYNSTFNISNKDSTVDKYLNNEKYGRSNTIELNDRSNYPTEIPIVKAYKATIQSIKSINDFQINDQKSKSPNINNNGDINNDKGGSYLIYSPEIKPLDLQPINYKETNHLNSSDTNLFKSNSTPLLNNTSNNSNIQYYPFNLLNSKSSSSHFSHLNSTQNTTNTTFSNSNNNLGGSANTNNLQYIAPIPTPITIDAAQQKILFPNNFHTLYK
ncbi:uncharacterized protein cubi_01580 [Cryptosporidium ubiquitum]|uniref:Uncharacterized protein n=1 Tax=Cryptosporidium ubiquitum TaxID=857276 RepID=A0A1J4ME27_9CRYT|nr:uncharacterized protein cubi_01580 [Cryptosporidium ubiquitum]OII72247.1 hypothetical protein cubi_01580 [Cryptosporidium ubiquitum]